MESLHLHGGWHGAAQRTGSRIARALVDDPDQVKVNVIESRNSLVLELSVSQRDEGKIIGKQGRNVNALRVILGATTHGHAKRCILEIIE